ncbi:MAG TPA: DsbA family protein [Coprothermobacter proteolyticus]|uniref:Dithiol-disulfide isomerase n=1 Tax=Coprothermobacter proteolyticus (strain ATCC 35245 / DSM 5265 / OCM 4 / BT) TaxID=309798 RepID=B5Y6L1_COPPD|nr:DsbA family protein [Coprothermobacter proteolyticus]ACI16967.1 dithiol-disulfide isomerase [Coprothermobacter proteolyticus DSM 5265]HRC95466.1 DsbA family protein [Coprothermobacter proteolyticus]
MEIEFFHDVLCAWCYALSPRLRRLTEEFPDIKVIHRGFPLAPEPNDIVQMFGSKEKGKRDILQHWKAANMNDDEHRINAELMEQRDFDYPYSTPALLACKAAELQGGQAMHWNYFDKVQEAHLTLCRNIADFDVLTDIARELSLDVEKFSADLRGEQVKYLLRLDIDRALELGVEATPTLVANDGMLTGAVPYDSLKRWYVKVRQ